MFKVYRRAKYNRFEKLEKLCLFLRLKFDKLSVTDKEGPKCKMSNDFHIQIQSVFQRFQLHYARNGCHGRAIIFD